MKGMQMQQSYTFYCIRFGWRYGVTVAALTAVIYALSRLIPDIMAMPMIQGAVVGIATGAMIAPFIDFAKTFHRIEGRRSTLGEGWIIAFFFGIAALFVNILLTIIVFAWLQVLGIGTALTFMLWQTLGGGLILLMMVSVPLFFVFQWSALKGQEARAARGT